MTYIQKNYLICVILFGIFSANCKIQVITNNETKLQESQKVFNEDYNPDVDLDTAQIIRRYGYLSEIHIVETADGYLLKIHRIPGDKSGRRGGQPVFLQHGLLSSSAIWVEEGNQSLGFMLADWGYDVWMGNARGNFYSKGHSSLNINSPQYWNFSWHEMGVYDLPAAFNYVSKITQKPGEIIYVGHSMGTTMFFVFASLKQQAAKDVKFMVSLAPVAYMTHVRSPIRYLAPFVDDIEFIVKHFGLNDFLPDNRLKRLLAYDCNLLRIEKKICENLIFALSGFDKEEFNENILDVVINHAPAGTSTKTAIHYSQEIKNTGDFRHFDYGKRGNLIEYGTKIPPSYNVTNIQVPTYLMYAENDLLASPIDVKILARQMNSLVGMYKVPLEKFNHVDFLFGKHAPELVNKPLLNLLQNYTTTN